MSIPRLVFGLLALIFTEALLGATGGKLTNACKMAVAAKHLMKLKDYSKSKLLPTLDFHPSEGKYVYTRKEKGKDKELASIFFYKLMRESEPTNNYNISYRYDFESNQDGFLAFAELIKRFVGSGEIVSSFRIQRPDYEGWEFKPHEIPEHEWLDFFIHDYERKKRLLWVSSGNESEQRVFDIYSYKDKEREIKAK